MKQHIKFVFLALCAALVFAGCTTAPDVTTYQDPLTGQQTELLSENELVVPGQESAREVVWLNASRLPIARNKYQVYLEVTYASNKETGGIDIYPGRTLTIVADGKELKFGGLGSSNAKREKGNVLYETALYEAQPGDIETIANAKKVTVLVQGKTILIERDFSAENFQRFKLFAAKISREPSRAATPTVRGSFQ